MAEAQTPEEIALVEFQENAMAADKVMTATLARLTQELAPEGVDQAFTSAVISGAMLALVRFYGTIGREMGAAVTPRMIITAFTPCLHRTAENWTREIIVDRPQG